MMTNLWMSDQTPLQKATDWMSLVIKNLINKDPKKVRDIRIYQTVNGYNKRNQTETTTDN